MSDFHSRIMNLQPDYAKPNAHAVVYKRGFRDARHVAAEVGLEADALLVRLAEQETKAEWAQHWKDKHDALAARLAEAERDAARYRWLRDDMARIDPVLSVVAKVHHDRRGSEWCNVHDLDATVDRVRAASSASGVDHES